MNSPAALESTEASSAWLSSMSDEGWRVLIDFHNWPNWIPGIQSVQQTDQDSPARGTVLQINSGRAAAICSIDRWDPPSSLCFSIRQRYGEVAYCFTIHASARDSQWLLSLELERSIRAWARPVAFLLEWQLRRSGAQTAANFISRMQPLPI